MAKQKTIFVCQNCGYKAPKWLGRCPDCNAWNSFVEELAEIGHRDRENRQSALDRPQRIDTVTTDTETRNKTGLREFDRTLGGGLVPGSLVLIGGDPGIGKSTLILQIAQRLAQHRLKTLYISGEESVQQIKMRATRLSANSPELYLLTATCLEDIIERLEELAPRIVVIDSIQTIFTESLGSAPGSIGQVREVTSRLMNLAKTSGRAIFLIGHVTKDGAIAGPKVLEHLVDTVLYFEGDGCHMYRILRAVKNRYGPTNEIGVFEMLDSGLQEVRNPSNIFLEERGSDVSGSIVISCMEGSRPLLVEMQALVCDSYLAMPRRTTIGVDPNRVSVLVAVLAKRGGVALSDKDIFINVAGGIKIGEPAIDLGIIATTASSFLNKPIPRNTVTFGEVGLSGEIRGVSHTELRLKEAVKLGFSRCLLSKKSIRTLKGKITVELIGVSSVTEVLEVLFA
ncbi:MAG: DNA repair protein RadA [Deltaproteobacteria bacterium]|nr:DNA repair protein RadA [Deltaproteobacteria bacterium]MBW2340159.1 DNA repair protein RadA [Deltaproteobacteria bacterium]